MSAASRPPRPRALFVAALLLLTLALAGAIALQAYRNFLGHKATAERVLRDYSRLAAARFAQRTEMAVYYHAFWPALDALSRAKAGRPGTELPAPNHLPVSSEPHAADFRKLARYTFRYDLRGGRLETAGGTPSAAVRRWLRDTLPVHSRTVYDPKEHLGAIVRTVDGLSRAIVYTVVNDQSGAPRTIVGIEEDPRGFEPLYTADEDKFPLLPRPLTGGVSYDSLGSAIVTGADGVELYRSPVQYPPLFAARDSFEEPMMGRVQVQVALRPDMAPKLVIGGMPRSNLPMLLSLLALTAGLVVAALLQLRREYELSRLRADFVSGVSHELRTPLAQIRMFSETLLLGRVRSDDERERSLEIIDQEARRLTHLVENLLHFSRSGPRLGRGRHGHRPVRGARARSAARRSHLGGGRARVGARGSGGQPVRDRAAAGAAGPRRVRCRDRSGRRGGHRMTRILVVEDNADLAFGLRNNLEIEGYEVVVVEDGTQGLARARDAGPDLIILDLMLPGLDGYRVLRVLRDEGRRMPILILTARGEESDKVRGLRLGADDYVTKPFGVLELLARVEALLRRTAPPAEGAGEPEQFGAVEVIPASRSVLRSGRPVALTPKEFDLLVALLRRGGAVASRMELLTEVWGYSAAVLSRTVDTHVAELRRKLETDPAVPRHILTVRKAGYRLEK